MEYIAFMAAILHNQIDYVENVLQEYDIGSYLIGLETTNDAHKETEGQHMHFLVQMNDKDYHKFTKRIFVDKYKLRGKALKDKPRQYGRVKKIEDLERMAAYTLKDKNIRSNMKEEDLAIYKEIAFKEKEKEDFRDKLMTYLVNHFNDMESKCAYYHLSMRDVIMAVIGYYRKLPDRPSVVKSQIDRHSMHYMMYYSDWTTEQIYQTMYPFDS